MMRGVLPSTVAKKRAWKLARNGCFAVALKVPDGDGRKRRENMVDVGCFEIKPVAECDFSLLMLSTSGLYVGRTVRE